MDWFADLQFEEKFHVYKLDGKRIPSMSSVIKELHEEFPYKEASENVARKFNKPVDIITANWEADKYIGISKGKDTHLVGEIDKRTYTVYDIAIKQFLHKIQQSSRYEIIYKELRAYTRVYWVAGTLDLLLYDTVTKSFIIVDYKTNKSLFKTYNDTLYAPFDDLVNNPYNKYTIQLNGYQIMLEEANLNISERWIIWVGGRSKQSLYQLYKTPLLTFKLKE